MFRMGAHGGEWRSPKKTVWGAMSSLNQKDWNWPHMMSEIEVTNCAANHIPDARHNRCHVSHQSKDDGHE